MPALVEANFRSRQTGRTRKVRPRHAPDLTPEQRARARIAALTLHAQVDSRQHTAPAREAFNRRFLDEVDPERVLPEPERLRRAECARNAYFAKLALKSSRARSARAAERAEGGGAA